MQLTPNCHEEIDLKSLENCLAYSFARDRFMHSTSIFSSFDIVYGLDSLTLLHLTNLSLSCEFRYEENN